MDAILPFPKAMLSRRLGAIAPTRISELCGAVRATVDC
jgi:mRNA-degrading endonuclease toxin of MazEF toxin-antitoxin module